MSKLLNLIEVKKIIAILMALVFCYLAIIGKVTPEQFLTVFAVVVGYYFGQSSVRQTVNESKQG